MEKKGQEYPSEDVFQPLWERRRTKSVDHSQQAWDKRARGWALEEEEKSPQWKKRYNRVMAVAEYLKKREFLTEDSTAIDIGCGPGQFVTEFARIGRHVTGIDLSPEMIRYGKRLADREGVGNKVSFESHDFTVFDVKKAGFENHFDLVFSSITPAIREPGSLEKMISMSRKYCFNCSFVYTKDPVDDEVSREVFGIDRKPYWDGHTFYAMFNLLWLWGYYPEIAYWKENSLDRIRLTTEFVTHYTQEKIAPEPCGDREVEQVYRYLEKNHSENGFVTLPRECWYGWTMWDVRDRTNR